MRLLDVPDVQQAKQVMDDIRAVKRQLPENPLVVSLSTLVHLTCYNGFEALGEPALRATALEAGRHDAQTLQQYPHSFKAVLARWSLLRETGQQEAAFAGLRRYHDETKENARDMLLCLYYGASLYLRGERAPALKVWEAHKGDPVADLFRLITLADLPDGFARAEEIAREVAARDLGGWDLFNHQLTLRFLGRKEEAVAVSRRFLKQPDRFPPVRQAPFQRALEYCAGQRSADDLIASMHGNRGDLSNAHLCIAMTALADGNRTAAREQFQRCVQTQHYECLPYDLGLMMLSRMDRDSKWPGWIK
jgi:hypothetical protein